MGSYPRLIIQDAHFRQLPADCASHDERKVTMAYPCVVWLVGFTDALTSSQTG